MVVSGLAGQYVLWPTRLPLFWVKCLSVLCYTHLSYSSFGVKTSSSILISIGVSKATALVCVCILAQITCQCSGYTALHTVSTVLCVMSVKWLLCCCPGLVAGACSMGIGEYVSVSGQRDIEEADVALERSEFERGPEAVAAEINELAQIYVARGLSQPLARQVAVELSASDPVRAHARDELGIDIGDLSDPLQASLASAASFLVGGIAPLVGGAFIADDLTRVLVVLFVTTCMFLFFGVLGAWLRGAKMGHAATRITVGGLGAIGITYGVLKAFGGTGL